MTQVIERHAGLLDKMLTIKPTARLKRLRQDFLSLQARIEIDRARIVTRVMKETEGEPWVMRRAKSFSAVVREIPVNISPDEMFVGYLGATRDGVPLAAESGPGMEYWLSGKQGAGRARGLGTVLSKGGRLSEKDWREAAEQILPYWRAQGRWERTSAGHNWDELLPAEAANLFYVDPAVYPPVPALISSTAYMNSSHTGHSIFDQQRVLDKGYLGIKKDAEERLARLDRSDPDELKKVPFLKGVVMAMEAASEVGERFAAKAREMAAVEQEGERKADLLAIAEVCEQVPAKPARTFREGLQVIWFNYILSYWETMEASGISFGRLDQYLFPYFERDIREGRLTKEEAQELVDCWLMKLQEADKPVKHLSVGGYKPDGSDATNELSYMFVEGMMHVRLTEPNLGIMIHSKTPDDLLYKACELVALGTGQPMFENCDVIVPALLSRGTDGETVTLEDARNAACVGCQESFFVGKDGNWQHTFINMAAAMEFALNDGVSRLYGRRMGDATGDASKFATFEEVREAYKKQAACLIKHTAIAERIREINMVEMQPTLFQSALTQDCIERGVCREAGGAHYNSGPGLFGTGLPNVADSLTAIRRVIFEDKRATMLELCDALDKNFEGYEELRRILLEAPKYGNDDDYADAQMAWVMHEWATEVMKQRNTRGGRMVPTSMALGFEVPFGAVVGALPSGRLAGQVLSNGSSPCDGVEVNGPTAVIKSLGKVNNFEISNGNILNMRLSPAIFEDRHGVEMVVDLLRTLVDQKVMHVQFNVVSSDTLRAAQLEPERYRDLVVRVAGYSAYFVRLSKALQEEIINRTEHGL